MIPVTKISKAVAEILSKDKLAEIFEKKSECKFEVSDGDAIVNYDKPTARGAESLDALLYFTDQGIKVKITYTPEIEDTHKQNKIIKHLNERNRSDKLLLAYYKEHNVTAESKFFPCPIGNGSETPITHHWSEYAGCRIECVAETNTSTLDKVAAKLASALTAKKDTIEKILGKEFGDIENKRKVDALDKLNVTDPKHILETYLDMAEHKLNRAKEKYDEIANSIELAVKNVENTEEMPTDLKKEVNDMCNRNANIEIAYTAIKKLKSDLNNNKLNYEQKEFVLMPTDLNLDNILIDKDYEVSFIDGTLREHQTLEDYFGPKQVLYFMFKKIADGLNERNGALGDKQRESDIALLRIFNNVETILREDYKIDAKKDHIIKEIVDIYFRSFDLKKDSEKAYVKYQNNYKSNGKITTKANVQSTIEASTANMQGA